MKPNGVRPRQLPPAPPEAWEPLLRLARLAVRPLEQFLRVEASSGLVLLATTAVALAWANSPWAASYHAVWATPIGVRVGDLGAQATLGWIVNDGLMTIFFFVIGLEIRRELHHGELSEWRRAALPTVAALGGMLVPALVFLTLAGAPQTRRGWGVPMATDIAFALGVLALLGKRAPPALRVLLLALAVIDDIGAIAVIALFYGGGLAWKGFALAGAGVALVFLLQRLGVRAKLAYVPAGLITWSGALVAGIHPTIAGVAIGMLTPVRAWLGTDGFIAGVHDELERLRASEKEGHLSHEGLAEALAHVDLARRGATSPAESLIHRLHPWVAFGVMPVFALANAGVSLSASGFDEHGRKVFLGTTLGLLLGKPAGVLGAMALAVRLRVATVPVGLGAAHLVVLGAVAGVGFTMALFVGQLAYSDEALLAATKLGVLLASGVAAALALGIGRALLSTTTREGAAATADEAESSTER